MRILPFTCLLMISTSVPAAVVLDQYAAAWSSSSSWAVGGSSDQKLAQTFQAGLSGRLDHIKIAFSCNGDSIGLFNAEVQTVGGDGLPDGRVLGRVSLLSSGLHVTPIAPQEIAFPGVSLVAGERYAIVLSADMLSSCAVAQGPLEGGIFHYPRGTGYFDARPNPPGWIRFTPQSHDLPFWTFMRTPEPAAPRYCEFVDASGAPNDWIPNHLPICGCLRDRATRANRCWFVTPEFALWREIGPFNNNQSGPVRWSLVPFDSQFSGLRVHESGIDAPYSSAPVEFPPNLAPGETHKIDSSYQGFAKQSLVRIKFRHDNQTIEATFKAQLTVPKRNGQ